MSEEADFYFLLETSHIKKRIHKTLIWGKLQNWNLCINNKWWHLNTSMKENCPKSINSVNLYKTDSVSVFCGSAAHFHLDDAEAVTFSTAACPPSDRLNGHQFYTQVKTDWVWLTPNRRFCSSHPHPPTRRREGDRKMNLSLLKRETDGAIEGRMVKRRRLRITDCFLPLLVPASWELRACKLNMEEREAEEGGGGGGGERGI